MGNKDSYLQTISNINPLYYKNTTLSTFNPEFDQFESLYIQRIKQTPFLNCHYYSMNPSIFIDNVELSLEKLISPRIPKKQYFPQVQIYNLIVSILNGLIQLQNHNYKGHGNISPQTIYYQKKYKIFKLTHPKYQISGYQLLLTSNKQFARVSPQQLLDLSQRQSSSISVTSDLFTFGILLCQIGTLTSSRDIYSQENHNIYDQEIQDRLNIIEKVYSRDLRVVIGRMLEYDQECRITPRQLLQYINKNINIKNR